MLVQIYETSTPEEARALADIGVDHIGVLVGDGSFPREHPIDEAGLYYPPFRQLPKIWRSYSLLT
jgi:hypothetical protein